MKILTLVLVGLMGLVSMAQAQEFGGVVGFHQTSADINAGSSVDGKLGFKLGGAVGFELVDGVKFRSGLLYNQRHFESTVTGTSITTKYDFDYFDVPANFQLAINEMVGIYGGLIVGINIKDDVSVNTGTVVDPNADTLIPIADVGVNLTFSDMIGFDFYYERGLGSFADNLKDYSIFGADFIYWY